MAETSELFLVDLWFINHLSMYDGGNAFYSGMARNRVDALDILANTSVENIFLLVLHKSWLTKNNSFYNDL